jgi:large repetitive protein
MKILIIFIEKNKLYFFSLLLVLAQAYTYGQSCNCPPVSQCGSCIGGITSLTLRYNGTLFSLLITAADQNEVLFSEIVAPGGTFSVTGSLPGGVFAGPLKLSVLIFPNATINTSCGVPIFINSTFGDFTVLDGESRMGGGLCCSSGDTESTDPIISNVPENINVALVAPNCSMPVTWNPPTATDNCGEVTGTSNHDPNDIFEVGTWPVTYTFTDDYGNFSTCTFNVTVSDNIKPSITGCLENITAVVDASCKATVSWTPPTATDNCGIPILDSNYDPGDQFPPGTWTVVYTAKDIHNNVSTCSFDVTVRDETAPKITGGSSDITISSSASCSAIATWAKPLPTDNCEISDFGSTHNSGDPFPKGTTTVVYTAKDKQGNISTWSFKVNVVDDKAPVITGSLSNITVAASNSCKATANWTPPIATDNCSKVTLASSHSPNSLFNLGTTVVTYTATDESNNVSTRSFNVIVVDQTAPVISGCSDIVAVADQSCQAKVTWTAPTVTDCKSFTLTSSHNPGAMFPVGSTEVTYTAVDANNNTSTCKFKVIVKDKTAPVFQNCVTEIIATASADCNAVVNWIAPIASDNCTVTPVITSSHTSGSTFNLGTTAVKFTATDEEGNASFCQVNVIVKNQSSPVFSDCSKDITAKGNEKGLATIDWLTPAASAKCGEVTLTSSHEPGEVFSIGTTNVEYKATDNTGNISYCKFNVIVSKQEIDVGIGKIVTPDGNGQNDEWIVSNIEKFKDNKVVIVDRWGSVIYTATGYNNESVVWKGVNQSGITVPTGTYFYTLSVRYGPSMIEKSGFIELIR